MILLIDNYDSFTYNLAHLFQELGADVAVRRNDEIAPDEAEILSELEQYRRGTYGGIVGYHAPGLGLDTCIAIRTVRLQDGRAYLQAGGGIVADSDPAAEHQECLNKLAALEAAIELAEKEQR